MKPTWRSQQRREEAARDESASAVTSSHVDAHEEKNDESAGEDDEPHLSQMQEESEAESCAPEQGELDIDKEKSDDDNVADVAVQDVVPEIPQEQRPTLEEYQAKWARLLAQHSKSAGGEFSAIDNLVPTPIHELWQDCPYVPFDQLKSEESQARLSVCKPISGLEEANSVGGVPRYAHNSGEVFFRRRSPLQLASTLGFVLDKQSGKFLGLRPQELDALHEILVWGRQPGHNKVLQFFGNTLEDFSDACRTLMSKFKDVLPKGSNLARVRISARDRLKPNESTLGGTLGEEATGMVVVDFEGHPVRYNQLAVYEDVVATHRSIRFDVEAVHDGRTWRRASTSLELDQNSLDDGTRARVSSAARALKEDMKVKANTSGVCAC